MLWKTALFLTIWLLFAILLRRGLRGSGLPPFAGAVALIGLCLTGFAVWQIGQSDFEHIRTSQAGTDGTYHITQWIILPGSSFLLPGLLCLVMAGLAFIAWGKGRLRWLSQLALLLAYSGTALILSKSLVSRMDMPRTYAAYATTFRWANTLVAWAGLFITIGLALLLILALTALIQTLTARKS